MPRLRVSDHAVLRYLERAGGFQIDALRQQMQERAAKVYVEGASFVVIDGLRFAVSVDQYGPCVTTVLTISTESGGGRHRR